MTQNLKIPRGIPNFGNKNPQRNCTLFKLSSCLQHIWQHGNSNSQYSLFFSVKMKTAGALGVRTKSWTPGGVGTGVRMHERDDVELALMALGEGWAQAEAGALVGASGQTVSRWAAGRVPHERRAGRIACRETIGEVPAASAGERAAYEAAMTENMLLRVVLDDLKGEGSHPGSMSNRRKCGLGERLRAETGLPLREVTAFLRVSKSSYEYHRARLGHDRDAALRPLVGEAFAAGRGAYGYRRVHAELRARGVRASESDVAILNWTHR